MLPSSISAAATEAIAGIAEWYRDSGERSARGYSRVAISLKKEGQGFVPLAFLALHTLRAFERITRGLPNVRRFLECGNRTLFAVALSEQHVHRELRVQLDAPFGRHAFWLVELLRCSA